MSETVITEQPRPRAKRRSAKWAILPLAALTLVAAMVGLYPSFQRAYQAYEDKHSPSPAVSIQKAQTLTGEGQWEDAFQALRQAMDKAATPDERRTAGMAMGQFLLKRARQQADPYAQMAQGYFESVLRLDPADEQKVMIYKALAEIGALTKDSQAVAAVCAAGRAAARTEADQVDFIQAELDAAMKIGSWEEVHRAWALAAPYREQAPYRAQFDLREAYLMERILTNDEWYQRWAQQQARHADPVTLRAGLFRQALAIYDRLAQTSPPLAEECMFRAAQLCNVENQFDETRRRIRAYFDQTFRTHREDIMLMLVRMARLEGDAQQTNEMISQFLERFQWTSKAASELLAIIDEAEGAGHFQEGLYYLEEYLKLPEARDELPLLRLRAGQLAARLKQYDRATEHWRGALEAGADLDTQARLALAMAEMHLQQGHTADARQWLMRVLTEFPSDPRRGPTLYRLINVFSKSGAPVEDVLLLTSLAVDVAPEDPQAVEVLTQSARTYERLGLFGEAQEKYARVALLRTADASGAGRAVEPTVLEALLGSARCLLHMGDAIRADRLLRELCQAENRAQTAIYNEAAYLWATLKIKENQPKEALRRLDLIDWPRCAPEIRSRAQLAKMVLEIGSNRTTPETIDAFARRARGLTEEERTQFVRQAYGIAFERLRAAQDLAGMQAFLDKAAAGPSARDLPLALWTMQMASQVLKGQGVPAFVACMQRNDARMENAGANARGHVRGLIELASSLEATKNKVNAYLSSQTPTP